MESTNVASNRLRCFSSNHCLSYSVCFSGDKLAGGLLPLSTPLAVVSTTGATPILALSRSVSSHVTKGYRQLEQDDDRTSTASDSGEEDDAAGGSTAESVDEQRDKDSDIEDFDSDFGQ